MVATGFMEIALVVALMAAAPEAHSLPLWMGATMMRRMAPIAALAGGLMLRAPGAAPVVALSPPPP